MLGVAVVFRLALVVAFVRASFAPHPWLAAAAWATASAVPAAAAFQRIACIAACRAPPPAGASSPHTHPARHPKEPGQTIK